MANSLNTEGTRILCSLLFFLVLGVSGVSQKVDKYYQSLSQENGTLYFIQPNIEFKGIGTLTFDLTYLSTSDSITLNYTFESSELTKIRALKLLCPSSLKLTSDAKKLYIDNKKKAWEHRYSSVYLQKEFEKVVGCEVPEFELISKNGDSIVLKPKTSQWQKTTQILSKIFQIIHANEVD